MQPYKHSGRFTPLGLVIALAAAVVAAFPLGWLYPWLMSVTTYVKLRMLETIAFGALVGLAAGYGLVAGKVRNHAIALLTGAVGGAVAHYVGWCFFAQHMVELGGEHISAWDLGTHPGTLWSLVQVFNQYGTWTEKNSTPTTGVVLWIFWSLEALTVVGMAAFVAYAIEDKAPFCETCEQWAKPAPPQYFQMSVARDQFKALLLGGNVEAIGRIPRATVKNPHYKLDLHQCPGCHNLNTVMVNVGGTRPAGSLVPKTLIEPDQAEKLRALASGPPLARPAGT
jgi:hypothetical protein